MQPIFTHGNTFVIVINRPSMQVTLYAVLFTRLL